MRDRDFGYHHRPDEERSEESRAIQLINGNELVLSDEPVAEWTDLPIARRKGKRPHFTLREILTHQDKTVRVSCQFEAVQQFLRESRGCIIPQGITDHFARLQKWQLVVPTHVDVAQPLFLGKVNDDRDDIAINDAQATIYIHRGADGEGKLDGGEYRITWVELAGIINDSNGDPRIVAATYNWWGRDIQECALAGVNVSFSETEYERILTPIDAFIPTAVNIADYRHGIYLTSALTTQGMIDSLPIPHKKAVNLLTNPKGGLYVYELGGRDKCPIDFDQGISLTIGKQTVTIGFNKVSDGRNPWTIDIPRTFEHTNSPGT